MKILLRKVQSLTLRYTLGLVAIALLVSGNQFFIQSFLRSHLYQVRHLGVVDRQLVAVESLGEASRHLQLAASWAEALRLRAWVRDDLTRFRDGHEKVFSASFQAHIDNDEDRRVDEQRDVLEKARAEVVRRADRIEMLIGATERPSAKSLILASGEAGEIAAALKIYRASLERFVQISESSNERAIRRFRWIEFFIYVMIVVVLVLEAVFVFRPGGLRLERALEARTEFLGRVSHEVRNPMNAIIGMGSLLLQTRLSNQQKDYLNRLLRSSHHLLDMLNRLVDFSQTERKAIQLQPETVEFSRVLEGIIDLMAVSAHSKRLDFILDLEPKLPHEIHVDSVRLEQVLVNLIGNAIKFTEEGHVLLKIQRDGPTGLRFVVEDTGPGIPSETLPLVFESFVQADSSIRRRYGGAGLGLSISRDLVRLWGGRIEVDSEIGKGSSFTFTVPGAVLENSAPMDDRADELALLRVLWLGFCPAQEAALRRFFPTAAKWVFIRGAVQPPAFGDFDRILLDDSLGMAQIQRVLDQAGGGGCALFYRTTHSLESFRALGNQGLKRLEAKPLKPWFLGEFLLKEPEAAVGQVSNPSGVRTPRPGAGTGPYSVLVAEDAEDNRLLIKAFLSDMPLAIVFANNGREALDWHARKDFDLVLMDLQMPEMDGHEAVQRIRERERIEGRPVLPIVAVSAHNDRPEETARCLRSGFNECLSKPFSRERLKAIVRRFLPPGASESPGTARAWAVDPAIADIVPSYVKARRDEAQELAKLLEKSDWERLRTIGHRLKGNARTYGFAPLGELGARLEEAAQAQDSHAANITVSGIREFLAELDA